MPRKSQILILIDKSLVNDNDIIRKLKLRNAEVKIQYGATTDRELLIGLGLSKYNHIILLSFHDRLSQQAADAKTLITLLHLRDIASNNEGCNYSILRRCWMLRP